MILRLAWPLWVTVAVMLPLLAVCVVAAVQARRTGEGSVAAWLRRSGMVLALTAIALAPAVPSSTSTVATNVEMFFVVDRTGSMAAEDYDGDRPRLDGVRHDVLALVEAMPGSRYSVITFDSQAARQLPLTTDARAVRTWADTLVQEITHYSAGSAVDRPLPALRTALEGAAERNPENVRIVFFLSDGENTQGDGGESREPLSYAELAPLVDGGAVLGYGTAAGAQMRSFDGSYRPDAPFIQDFSQPGEPPAVSRIDEANLRAIAEQLGVPYVHRPGPGPTADVVAGIDVAELAGDGRGDITSTRDVVWPWALAAGLLLLWEAWAWARAAARPGRWR